MLTIVEFSHIPRKYRLQSSSVFISTFQRIPKPARSRQVFTAAIVS